jgi:hypothetical protein
MGIEISNQGEDDADVKPTYLSPLMVSGLDDALATVGFCM